MPEPGKWTDKSKSTAKCSNDVYHQMGLENTKNYRITSYKEVKQTKTVITNHMWALAIFFSASKDWSLSEKEWVRGTLNETVTTIP